ncbi:DUF819 family protein [Flavobacteriaceae bacterium]|jgi:uncharacterized membrane protein|nr:DUF819 family protein [Flavobacteriaceae bacterium]
MTAAVLITIFTVLLVLFLERLNSTWIKKIFNWLPSILLAYLIPAVCSYILNRDFSEVTIHQWSKDLFIPLAIVAVMSSLSVSQLKKVGWKPIAVFLSGSLWIAIFPVGFLLFFQNTDFVSESLLGLERWKGIPPIVGSWIGGSTSQLVLKELVACPEALFLTILVLDNILVNLWTIGMFQTIKKSDTVNRLLGIQSYEPPSEVNTNQNKSQSPLLSISILLGSVFLAHISLPSFVGKVVALSLLGLGFGFFIKSWNSQFTLQLGSILILLVMAVLGLKLQFDLIQFDIVFMGFLVVWLSSHFLVMLGAAKLLNVHAAWVPIASMANVGGIATAPAVTAAYEKKWMPHAIILAVLSMATGTFWGMVTVGLIQFLLL